MKATLDDLEKVYRLGLEFHAYSPHSGDPVCPDDWRETARQLIENGSVFVSENGFIGGVVGSPYFNKSVRHAFELFWWAPDGNGRKLQQEFRAWCREQGAVQINWTALHDEHLPRIDKIYRRQGAIPVEVAYRERF